VDGVGADVQFRVAEGAKTTASLSSKAQVVFKLFTSQGLVFGIVGEIIDWSRVGGRQKEAKDTL
jgi:hypothetical protein